MLGEALKLIRFPLMSIEEFISGPVKSGLLTEQVNLAIFFSSSQVPKHRSN